MACEEEPSRRRFGGLQGKTPSPQMNASNKNDPLETRKREIKPIIWRRTSRRVFHSSSCGIFSPRLTLVYPTRKIKDFSRGDPGAACSTLLADQMRRLRYSVVLRTPYESRRERQSKRGRQLLLLLWSFKRPNLAAKFATNRNVSLDKSKSFLQSVTHVAVGSTPIRQAIFSVTSCVE